MKREKIEKMWENLWLPTTVDWSYRVNRFELGSRSDPSTTVSQSTVSWSLLVHILANKRLTDGQQLIKCRWIFDCNCWMHMLICFCFVLFVCLFSRIRTACQHWRWVLLASSPLHSSSSYQVLDNLHEYFWLSAEDFVWLLFWAGSLQMCLWIFWECLHIWDSPQRFGATNAQVWSLLT